MELSLHYQGPGLFFIMPCIDTYKKVDLRTVSFDVPPQEVLAPTSPKKCIYMYLYKSKWNFSSHIFPFIKQLLLAQFIPN